MLKNQYIHQCLQLADAFGAGSVPTMTVFFGGSQVRPGDPLMELGIRDGARLSMQLSSMADLECAVLNIVALNEHDVVDVKWGG